MISYSDSLRGYGDRIFERDNFTCRYCGADGGKRFEVWLTLSVDHLLPVGHVNREDVDFKVTSCQFCNTADNLYFSKREKYGLVFDGKSPEQLVEQRKPYVQKVRDDYYTFWVEKVRPKSK